MWKNGVNHLGNTKLPYSVKKSLHPVPYKHAGKEPSYNQPDSPVHCTQISLYFHAAVCGWRCWFCRSSFRFQFIRWGWSKTEWIPESWSPRLPKLQLVVKFPKESVFWILLLTLHTHLLSTTKAIDPHCCSSSGKQACFLTSRFI